MKHTVTQEDGMGCGAACVAFAANIPYEQAARLLNQDKARTDGYRIKELAYGLGECGLTYRGRHVNSLGQQTIFKEGVIVFIRRSKRYPYGHYLIRHKDLWMDPWINLPNDKIVTNARSGYRKRLPGKAQWVILPV